VIIWAAVSIFLRGQKKCFDTYYFNPEFWILDGVRLLELIINCFFLADIIRVLWIKVRESHSGTEMEQTKKSVKAALMLIPLLGIPNILQMIPVIPSKNNIYGFGIYTMLATLFYMFQGFFISMVYCFTNREVIISVRSRYERFQMRHASFDMLRRGSRAPSARLDATTNGCLTRSLVISESVPPHKIPGAEKSAVKRESGQSDQTQQTGTSGSGSSLNHASTAARVPNTAATTGQNLTERSALLNPVERCETPPPSYDQLLYDEHC